MRGRRFVQLLQVLDLLSKPHGATRKQIAEQLDISDRSVSRMLNIIEEMGFPLYDDKPPFEKEKHWHLEESYMLKLPNISIPDIRLSLSEMMSLFMLKGESVIFKGTEVDRQITTAFAKLSHFIPEKTQPDLKKLKRIFISKSVSAKNYAGSERIIAMLTECALNATTCNINYHAFYKDKIKDTEIGPLHFYENNGGLYLFALKISDQSIRSYAIERIIRIKPLENEFDYPENFNPEETLDSAFNMTHGEPVTVTVRFSNTVAKYIRERKWAKQQTLTEAPDGSITLTMTTSGSQDVKRWIMSYGADAAIIEPEKMKKEIMEEFEKSLKKYRMWDRF